MSLTVLHLPGSSAWTCHADEGLLLLCPVNQEGDGATSRPELVLGCCLLFDDYFVLHQLHSPPPVELELAFAAFEEPRKRRIIGDESKLRTLLPPWANMTYCPKYSNIFLFRCTPQSIHRTSCVTGENNDTFYIPRILCKGASSSEFTSNSILLTSRINILMKIKCLMFETVSTKRVLGYCSIRRKNNC